MTTSEVRVTFGLSTSQKVACLLLALLLVVAACGYWAISAEQTRRQQTETNRRLDGEIRGMFQR